MFSVPQERIYSRRVYDRAAAAAYTAEMHTGFAVELVMLPHSEELLVLRKLLYLLLSICRLTFFFILPPDKENVKNELIQIHITARCFK